MAADASAGFDLMGGGGVLRSTLVRVNDKRHLLSINAHHIAFDGDSTGVVLRELGALYQALSGGGRVEDARLPELKVQYVDYALWQRQQLSGALDTHREYWHSHLREGALPVLELQTDFSRPAAQTFNGAKVALSVAADVTAKLEALARSHGCTLYQAVLGLWALLLCLHSGQDEVVIGTPYHGRDAAGTEPLVGYFVNMLALLLEVPRGGSVAELLRGAHAAAVDGMRHAALPFQQVVHELLGRRTHDASRNAVFQSILAWGVDGGWASGGDSFGTAVVLQQAALVEHHSSHVDVSLDASVTT